MRTLGLIGQKIGMTSIFAEDGKLVPVTVVRAGPCSVTQIKDENRDGYCALQIGFDQVPERKLNRPEKGHQAKAGNGYYRNLQEIRLDDVQGYETGQELTVDMFQVGERVKVSGRSKGKGFAGVIKRWNFGGAPATHGAHKVHRQPGAIGQCADPARVFKGKKMPGQMGNRKVTVSNLEVIDVRPEDNVVLIRGQVPGPRRSVVMIRKQG
jgi:large subunit ribosomal protein L3